MYRDRSTVSVHHLISSDDDHRNIALARLDTLKTPVREKVRDELIAETAHDDPQARRFALYALRRLKMRDVQTATAAANLLTDQSPEVQAEAKITLIESGPAGIEEASRRVSRPAEQAAAIAVLTRAGPAAAPALIRVARTHAAPSIRLAAVRALSRIEGAEKEINGALLKVLSDADGRVRFQAALILAKTAEHRPAVLPVLLQAAEKNVWGQLECAAVKELGAYGPSAKAAVPALNRAIREGRDGFGDKLYPAPVAAEALATIAPRSTRAHDLGWDLKSRDEVIRYRAAWHLSVAPNPSLDALEPLVGALSGQKKAMTARTVIAITRLGVERLERLSTTAYPALLKALTARETMQLPGFSARVLPEIEKIGVRLFPVSVDMVRKNKLNADTPFYISAWAKPTWEDLLVPLLKDPRPELRLAGLNGLLKFDPKRPGLGEVAAQLEKDPNSWISGTAGQLRKKLE